VHELATGRYIEKRSPVLIVGPCGTDKSHLAQALGYCAIRQGVDVVFGTCAQITANLNAARATGAYERKLAALARVPLLIIDDFGLKPLRPPADEDLHDLIAERYEQTATILTSNLDFSEWDQAFPANRLLASATLDRLRHNAYCLVLDADSFRAPRLPPTPARPKVANGSKSMQALLSRCPRSTRLLYAEKAWRLYAEKMTHLALLIPGGRCKGRLLHRSPRALTATAHCTQYPSVMTTCAELP
jgi:hypothetical protein